MLPKDEIDPEVLRKLQTLKAIAPRDARKTAEGHAAFMEIAKYELEGVSPMGEKRHNGWKWSKDSNQTLHRKEHSRMFNNPAKPPSATLNSCATECTRHLFIFPQKGIFLSGQHL